MSSLTVVKTAIGKYPCKPLADSELIFYMYSILECGYVYL